MTGKLRLLSERRIEHAHRLTLEIPETKIAEFANRVDLDDVAHKEPPHLDLHCLPSGP